VSKSIDGRRTFRNQNEYYIFLSEDAEHKFKKILYIHFRRIETHFIDRTAENKNNLDYGVINFGGYNFKYYERIERTGASGAVTKYLMDAGYIVPTCILRSAIYIIPYKDLWITINYWENVTSSRMSCNEKYSSDTLSDEQKVYLTGFHNRAFASIGMGGPETTQQISPTTTTPSAALKGKKDSPKKSAKADGAINVSSLSVFNFNATNLDASRYGPEVTNLLTDALGKNQAFSIISRHDLQEFLRLNDLQQNDNLGNLVNIGSRLGLNFIVTGRIEKKGVILAIECIVVNVHDEKVIFTRKVQVLGDSNLASEVSKMSDGIAAAIATSAR
jgi:TolB-like protein